LRTYIPPLDAGKAGAFTVPTGAASTPASSALGPAERALAALLPWLLPRFGER
jgi:hypothetical protein